MERERERKNKTKHTHRLNFQIPRLAFCAALVVSCVFVAPPAANKITLTKGKEEEL